MLTGASERGPRIDRTVTDVGSGLGGSRAKFRKLLADPTVTTIVVEQRDRLAGFGVEYLMAALVAYSRTIVVLDNTEIIEDVMRDVNMALAAMCARLYARRCAARRAADAVQAAANPPDAP